MFAHTAIGQLRKTERSSASNDSIPKEFLRLSPYKGNPVFTAAGEDSWEVNIRERGWILWDKDHYKLYFTGYDGTRAGQKKLGLATSDDGIEWIRHVKNPIYAEHWVEDMMVVKNRNRYYMFAEGAADQAQLLISDDGISWSRTGAIDVRRAADGKPIEAGPYGTPTAIVVDKVWHLFYERRDQGIWLATSRDMKTWTNVQDEPVIKLGESGFDARMIALNQVFRWNDQYVATYHGTGSNEKPRTWACGIAISKNLRSWRRIKDNPILPAELNLSSGIYVFRPESLLRFYTMHDSVRLFESAARLNASASGFKHVDESP